MSKLAAEDVGNYWSTVGVTVGEDVVAANSVLSKKCKRKGSTTREAIVFWCPRNTYGKVVMITNRAGVTYVRPAEVEVFESTYKVLIVLRKMDIIVTNE